MADSWDAASKTAMKILGDKGKIPKASGAISKASDTVQKTYDDFKKVREDLKSKLLALQNAGQAHKNAVSQFQDLIEENDLGLNRKDKDEVKKIVDARKVLSGFLQDLIDVDDEDFKNEKELDKHLMSMANYKK